MALAIGTIKAVAGIGIAVCLLAAIIILEDIL